MFPLTAVFQQLECRKLKLKRSVHVDDMTDIRFGLDSTGAPNHATTALGDSSSSDSAFSSEGQGCGDRQASNCSVPRV
jgi:hypothetical protein